MAFFARPVRLTPGYPPIKSNLKKKLAIRQVRRRRRARVTWVRQRIRFCPEGLEKQGHPSETVQEGRHAAKTFRNIGSPENGCDAALVRDRPALASSRPDPWLPAPRRAFGFARGARAMTGPLRVGPIGHFDVFKPLKKKGFSEFDSARSQLVEAFSSDFWRRVGSRGNSVARRGQDEIQSEPARIPMGPVGCRRGALQRRPSCIRSVESSFMKDGTRIAFHFEQVPGSLSRSERLQNELLPGWDVQLDWGAGEEPASATGKEEKAR